MLGMLDCPLHMTADENIGDKFKEVQHDFWNKLPIFKHSYVYPKDHRLACKMCMNSSEATALTHHQDHNHSSENTFSCDVCGRCFTQAADVARHTRVHTGEKPYTCNVCAKSFSQSGDLTRHARIHTGEKPFSCTVCTKSFTQSGSLTRHLRVHTGEKPFSCSICMRSFSQSGDSIRHIRVHKNPSPVSLSQNTDLPQETNLIHGTQLPNNEQKLVFSNVLSMTFSHATSLPHIPQATYSCLPGSEPSPEMGVQRNVLDPVHPKSSKLEKFALGYIAASK